MRDALLNLGIGADLACCIYPTAPMMTPEDLRVGLKALQSTGWDPTYAFSVTTYDFPVQRALQRFPQGGVRSAFPGDEDTRSRQAAVHASTVGCSRRTSGGAASPRCLPSARVV